MAGLPSGTRTVLGSSVPERPDVNAGKLPDVQGEIDVALKRLDRGGRS
jgi:hypothetical protein